ncbi:hypothetical protein [uncultured Aquimarina sp.]|uniref:hypothetical protein n=1 Tax=uncultured Aquimarina sp. TaxID=575652 RepID=UPI0026233D70|nr:hypothetical protein [uncultured Aquimarina sp.]
MKYLNEVFRIVKKESPILYWAVLINFIIAIVCIVGLFIDDRTLEGISVWIKPLKFSISIAIYTLTVGYLMTIYPYSKRKKNIINNIVSYTLLLELGIIFYQASRGVPSHYNESTPFDAILFLGMGFFIGINVLIMLLFIFDTIRLKLDTTKSIQYAILMGWLIIFFGSWVGGQMITQMTHNVGPADEGTGLPLVNWSTISGDLRVAHFFGLHGIQIIPLFALWVSKKWKASNRNQIVTVLFFGLLYATWIGFTFYQAKQGMPLLKL